MKDGVCERRRDEFSIRARGGADGVSDGERAGVLPCAHCGPLSRSPRRLLLVTNWILDSHELISSVCQPQMSMRIENTVL